ncbi:sialic acid-binding Ig-like lectin 9 isoform X3 [Rhinatrema bivittatum]|uniref:sialic acid-binding Ig-like lectin 9 isoform X3 n=1 Tax=Rhinatrema bivittatum TaxID=194408 RepID=UPI001129B1E9|nr:sialic acid-binding Ig-like lectin 9 isoform X3 [Rhinatrema bivittatum]
MQRAGLLLLSALWEGFLYQVTPTDYYMNSTDSVTVQQGLCVIIPCKFGFPPTVILGDNPHGYWFREADIPGINKPVATNDGSREVSENTRDRFQLVGDLKKQDCTLRINDAKKEDIGRYFFRIEGGFLYSFFNKIRPFVNITDLRERPKISYTVMLNARIPVNVACTAPGRCAGTAPIITWTGTLNRANSTTNTSSANRNGTVTHTSRISFIPSVRDYNKTLTCVVYYPAVKAYTQRTLSLGVESYSKQLDTELVSWIICVNIIIVSLTALAAYYCGRRIKSRERELDDLETAAQEEDATTSSTTTTSTTSSSTPSTVEESPPQGVR